MIEKTQILVSVETRTLLKDLKQRQGETYDKIINRLIVYWKEQHGW